MELKDFLYDLPEELIAQHPLHQRDKAKLMIIDRKRKLVSHDIFSNIDKYLPKNSVIVLNDSKVIPARLLSKRQATGGEVEIFLLKKLDDGYSYEVLMRPTKRLKEGEKIMFCEGRLVAEILDKEKRIVRFNRKDVSQYLNKYGHIPLPPYIRRTDNPEDRKYYQTVYAKNAGSVASPTAGLHFTNRLLNKIQGKGFLLEKVTLHVSYGTFKLVEDADITKHNMHIEEYAISEKAYQRINDNKKNGRKIISVGTTSCRVLETVANKGSLSGETDIFIYPGYNFKMVDCLITNFHLPKSTLLMLVYAFGGEDLMKKAYKEAIKNKYRFFSYGDAMLII